METLSRYALLEVIGRGNMGVVYKARDPAIERLVAIKIIELGFAHDDVKRDQFIERFRREAQIVGMLTHPNIVTVHDVGTGEPPFLVMEYVHGGDLSARLKQGLPAPSEVLQMARQLASALSYAHERGVIHRDLKPANVLYQPGPVVKLVDFGIAKLEAPEATATGELIGTPSFMAPEMFTGKPVDGRADLFSLGVILYQLLTGDRPFEGDSVSRTIYRVVHEMPPPVSKANPKLDRGWDTVMARLLAKEPDARYNTADELARDLDALSRGSLKPPVSTADEPTTPVNRPASFLSHHRWTMTLGVLLLLCMAMLVAIRVSMESMSARLPEPEVEAEREVDQPMALLEAAADALERGDLETSAAMLERATTTQGDALEGAEELRFRLERERWRATLPLRFVARHEHRVGHCTGDLVLRAESIRFESSRHRDWLWEATDVERLDRVDDDELELLGSEPDGNAGDIERYRFTMLRPSMGIDAFREYRKFFGH